MRRNWSSVGAKVLAALFVVVMSAADYGQAIGEVPVEQFVLTGVVVLDGEHGVAWLQEPNLTGNRVVALRVGETIGPYRLEKVFEDHVDLKGPAGRVMVSLYNASAPGSAVASVPEGANSTPALTAERPHKAASVQSVAQQAFGKFLADRQAQMTATRSAPEEAKARAANWRRLFTGELFTGER